MLKRLILPCVTPHWMLCYVMLCYVMLCYVTLRYVTLRYVTLRYVTLRYVMLCYVMLCYVMLCYVQIKSKIMSGYSYLIIASSLLYNIITVPSPMNNVYT